MGFLNVTPEDAEKAKEMGAESMLLVAQILAASAGEVGRMTQESMDYNRERIKRLELELELAKDKYSRLYWFVMDKCGYVPPDSKLIHREAVIEHWNEMGYKYNSTDIENSY